MITPADIDPDVYRVSVMILLIIIGISFILTVIRTFLDHKLKNKMLDKGISETLVASFLQKDSDNAKHTSMKWVFILIASGIGLFITNQYLPLGLHSIGVMAISIAVGFLLNTLYLNRFNK
jgi:hypothetical protein